MSAEEPAFNFIDVGTAQEDFTIIHDVSKIEAAIVAPKPTKSDIVSKSFLKAICDEDCQIVESDDSDERKATSPANRVTVEETEAINSILQIQTRRLKCPECKTYSAENEDKLLRHIRFVHRGVNPFQCFMCDYSTYNKSLFDEHTRIHQGIKPFKCHLCTYRSVSKKNLKKHILIHRPDNPLKCLYCGFIAKHNPALQYHNQICNSLRELKCNSCEFVTNDLDMYNKHLLVHPLDQPKVGDGSKVTPILEGTQKVGKKKRVRRNAVCKFNFNCQVCTWKTQSKPKALLHLIHHPNQEVDESLLDTSVLKKHGIMR